MSPPTNNQEVKTNRKSFLLKRIKKMSNTNPPIYWGSTKVHGNGK
jgi:hypothetical protein